MLQYSLTRAEDVQMQTYVNKGELLPDEIVSKVLSRNESLPGCNNELQLWLVSSHGS